MGSAADRERALAASAARYPAPRALTLRTTLAATVHAAPMIAPRPGALVHTNIVSAAALGTSVHPQDVAERRPWFGAFNGASLQLRLLRPAAVCTIFPSGKCNMAGPDNAVSALLAAWRFVALLRAAGVRDASVSHFAVCNYNATTCVDAEVDVYAFRRSDFPNMTSHFERFAGVTIRSTNAVRAVVTMFSTGNFNIVGSSSPRHSLRMAEQTVARLGPYLVTTEEGRRALRRKADDARHGRVRAEGEALTTARDGRAAKRPR